MGFEDPDQVAIGAMVVGPMVGAHRGVQRLNRAPRLIHNRQQSMREPPESPATRPEDLGVRSWYNEQLGTVESPSSSGGGGVCDRGSYPSSSSSSFPYSHRDVRSLVAGRPNLSLYSVASRERESSLESNDATFYRVGSSVPRKAYMDLTDAMALLDETCPNQDASPSLTPKTPRTPLTPFPRSRRTRSKSSDNSSNYSNDVTTGDRSLETSRERQQQQQQETKSRRPFLRKIGISKTEDRPFLAKIIAPRIIGKPYLEKIGPSRAVEKPFLEKIGSSRTLERFTFDTLRELPRAMVRRCQPMEPSPLTIERKIRAKEIEDDLEEDEDDVVLCIIKDERDDEDDEDEEDEEDEDDDDDDGDDDEDNDDDDDDDKKVVDRMSLTRVVGSSRRSNGKGYLLKMYSFETEDLNETTAATTASMKAHRDPLRGASLDDVLDSGPSSFPPSEDSHEHPSSRSDDRSTSVAELVKCRVTTSEEIFSTRTGHQGSPREATSWGNSPSRWPQRRSRRVASAPRTRAEREQNPTRVFPSDESSPNSPTKRRISPESLRNIENRVVVVARTKNSATKRDSGESPSKARRQASNEEPGSSDSRRDADTSRSSRPSSNEHSQRDEAIVKFAKCKSRRQTFKEAVEKFGGSEHSTTKTTRRQVSEEILDRNRINGQLPGFGNPHDRFERRGISSDNLKLSRETMVASVPSTSSLGYQSGDSSVVSQRSSYHSQDFVRGTLKILHDKFELREVPSESYAAFKRRTRANQFHYNHHHYHHQKDNQRTNTSDNCRDSPGNEETTINNNHNNSSNNNNNNNEGSHATTNLAKGNNEARDSKDIPARLASEEASIESKSSITTKSVLRKQEGVDHQSDHETDNGSSLRRSKRRMINEPSQETMDLLTELRRVKSLLKTPSIETDDASNDFSKPVTRFPKKILLTDKEFCLSVERENSVRRRPSMLARDESVEVLKKQDSHPVSLKQEEDGKEGETSHPCDGREKIQGRTNSRRQRGICGSALFEKRCLSLDYADDEKPPKPEARAISLVDPSRTPRLGTGEYETLDSSDPAGLAYDARSYSSDVFTSPSDENEEPRGGLLVTQSSEQFPETGTMTTITSNHHCADIDIAIPVDHVGSISPKRRIHVQGRTSDLYEIISPRSTPFRVKKRLGRISVEETTKQESFTLSKVDCRSVVTQKRTKCFPL